MATLIHITGNGHKVHHAVKFDDSPDMRSVCGSERWGTYRNPVTTDAALSCARCQPKRATSCTTCAAIASR